MFPRYWYLPAMLAILCGMAVFTFTSRRSAGPPNSEFEPRGILPVPGFAENVSFVDWTERWEQASESDRRGLRAEGARLAAARRAVLFDLMEKDPRKVIEAAILPEDSAGLPDEIKQHLETRVSGTGDSILLAAVPGDLSQACSDFRPSRRVVQLDGHRYEAFTYGRRTYESTRRNVPLHGVAIGDRLALSESPGRKVAPGEVVPEEARKFIDPSHIQAPTPEEETVVEVAANYLRFCCSAHQNAYMDDLANGSNTPAVKSLAGDLGGGGTGGPNGIEWTTGPKSLLVIRVDFSDRTGAPKVFNTLTGLDTTTVIDSAYCLNVVNNQVAPFYQAMSYGATTLSLTSGNVTNVLRMPGSAATYANSFNGSVELAEDAIATATANGHNPGAFDRVAIVFSNIAFLGPEFFYGGLGEIGGSITWYNGFFDRRIVTHELGHNMGIPHANRWSGSTSHPADPSGSSVTYGDAFDNMGSGPSPSNGSDHFNQAYTRRLGWLPGSASVEVMASGVYRLHRFDHISANGSNTLELRVFRDRFLDGPTGRLVERSYSLGYRRKFANSTDGRQDSANGVLLYFDYDDGRSSNLIDVDNPASVPENAALNPGPTFQDAGVTFQVVGQGGTLPNEYLDIQITLAPRVRFVSPVDQAVEGTGSKTILVERSGQATGAISVQFATSNGPSSIGVGTATAGSDYTTTNGILTWASGDSAPKPIAIPIASDASTEGPEAFTVTLTNPTGGAVLHGATCQVRITEPGNKDITFLHEFTNSAVYESVRQPDGNIIAVGQFAQLQDTLSLAVVPCGGIARFDSNGRIDPEFVSNLSIGANVRPVRTVALQPDGKILVGGNFTSMEGLTRQKLARLNSNGTVDTGFNIPGSGPNGEVKAVAVQADGRIVIGGNFTSINGVARKGIARLLPDGSLDTGFVTTPDSDLVDCLVEAIVIQPDQKILIGGGIYSPVFGGLIPGAFASGILRLNASNGTVDTSYNVGNGPNNFVYALALQPDGKVIVGGNFTACNQHNTHRIARLLASGAVDTSFVVPTTENINVIWSLTTQQDGKVLAAGRKSNSGGNYLSRLATGGARDTSFNPFLSNSPTEILDVNLDPANRVLVSTNYGGSDTAVQRLVSGLASLPGTIGFATTASNVTEGSPASLTVQRRGGSYGTVSVAYAVAYGEGSATSGADYPAISGVLTWANGDSSPKTINFTPVADGQSEVEETLVVQLGSPVGGSLDFETRHAITINPQLIHAWRLEKFGTTAINETTANDADPDLDGLENLLEYALGTAPLSAAGNQGAAASPEGQPGSGSQSGRFTLVFDLPTPAPSDITYTVEANSNPGAAWTPLARKQGAAGWTILAAGASVTEAAPVGGQVRANVADSLLSSSQDARFMRLRVEAAP